MARPARSLGPTRRERRLAPPPTPRRGRARSARRQGSPPGLAGSRLMRRRRSVRFPRHLGAALADEEVEIGALMCLHHMVDIELGIAAVIGGRRRLPCLAALREFTL